jgi:predicted PurR-regulated permease PerM
MSSRRWSNVTKIIVAAALAILALILIITFRALIPATIVAFLLAFILSYPVNWIQRQTGWARSTAVASSMARGITSAGVTISKPSSAR